MSYLLVRLTDERISLLFDDLPKKIENPPTPMSGQLVKRYQGRLGTWECHMIIVVLDLRMSCIDHAVAI